MNVVLFTIHSLERTARQKSTDKKLADVNSRNEAELHLTDSLGLLLANQGAKKVSFTACHSGKL